jgi:hypothetical protein
MGAVHESHDNSPRSDGPKWLSPANIISVLALMTAPGMVSLYQSWSARRSVDDSLLIVGTGTHEFPNNAAWTDSEAIKGWRESKARVRFVPPVPCPQPDVRVALSSIDLGGGSRVDVAAPDEERTADGFLLVARTWGGPTSIPWIKVDWFAACRGSVGKSVAATSRGEGTGP